MKTSAGVPVIYLSWIWPQSKQHRRLDSPWSQGPLLRNSSICPVSLYPSSAQQSLSRALLSASISQKSTPNTHAPSTGLDDSPVLKNTTAATTCFCVKIPSQKDSKLDRFQIRHPFPLKFCFVSCCEIFKWSHCVLERQRD